MMRVGSDVMIFTTKHVRHFVENIVEFQAVRATVLGRHPLTFLLHQSASKPPPPAQLQDVKAEP